MNDNRDMAHFKPPDRKDFEKARNKRCVPFFVCGKKSVMFWKPFSLNLTLFFSFPKVKGTSHWFSFEGALCLCSVPIFLVCCDLQKQESNVF